MAASSNGRREERAGGVRLVVLGEEDRARRSRRARVADLRRRMKSFSLSHSGIAIRNERKPARRDAEVGLEDALELEQRLVVEADVVEVRRRAMPALAQAVRDRVRRESRRRASCG